MIHHSIMILDSGITCLSHPVYPHELVIFCLTF